MRSHVVVATLGIAALVFGAGPALAQTSTDTPTMKEKVQQKAEGVGDKIKDTTHDMKMGATDSWITSKTKIALYGDERVKGRQVHVSTKDGVVTLRGKVDSADAKEAAGEITGHVEHVTSVKNELEVVAPEQRKEVTSDDKIIAKNVETALKRDPALQHAKVEVNNGVVSLSGDVNDITASARASEMARSVGGVRSVKNDLTYPSRTSLRQ